MNGLVVCALSLLALLAQLPPGNPSDLRFEVASLKLSNADRRTQLIHTVAGGARYEAVNAPLRLMLQVAFRIRPEQIVGIPGWLDTRGFDMQAKAEKTSSADELHVMLVNLLIDRMHLKYHSEKRNMQMYELRVAKDGPRNLPRRASSVGDTSVDLNGLNLQKKLLGVNARMDFVAFRLSNEELGRPVVDLTGLKGTYDFELNYTHQLPLNFPDSGKINGQEPDTSGPNLFAALKDQLGLELKAEKEPVDVIVVDHAERLTEN